MKLKKFFSIIFVFLILINLFLTPPANAIAVEVIGGSYVTYAILAAALAAAGYTVATNQVSPEIFQGILDSPNSELVKALIGTTTLFATAKGQVFFNWTSSQWSTFTNWVNSYIASGSLVIPSSGEVEFLNFSGWNGYLFDSYYEKYIRTTSGNFAYYVNGSTVVSYVLFGTNAKGRINFSNAFMEFGQATTYSTLPCYMFGSPPLINGSNIVFSLGIGTEGTNGTGAIATAQSSIKGVKPFIQGSIGNHIFYHNGLEYIVRLVDNHIRFTLSTNSSVYYNVTGTVLYPYVYSTLLEYWTDCINTGSLVGDFTGLGDDVINPGRDIDVGIDAYPDYQVGEGTLSIPDVIGGSIDIPLNPYIDEPIDLSHDPVPIDFTDWPDRTIETTPDDVVPDVRLNPPADVTASPDTPWADDESYPLDYPTDTTTDNLPPGNNPNPDPGQDEKTNRLKLGPILLSKFPFCLPWDLMHGLKVLVAPAEAPQFTIPFVNERLGINTSININLSFADTLARVTRWFLSALWVVILILITSKIIWK